MPHFHFDIIKNNHDRSIDEEGVEFDTIATMENEAMRAAGTMLSELSEFPREPWTMIVRDAARQTVATLMFTASR